MLTTTSLRNKSPESGASVWLNVTCAAALWTAAVGSAGAQILAATNLDASMMSAPACVPGQISVPVVEWDLSALMTNDAEPGAITVDVQTSSSDPSRVWFVTRASDPQLYRVIPGRARHDSARWRAWSLQALQPTGGLKKVRPSKDNRYVFVRTPNRLQRVDTKCPETMPGVCDDGLTIFTDSDPQLVGASDVALDSSNNVFTVGVPPATAPDVPLDASEPVGEYVQKINPNVTLGTDGTAVITATRWHVGGGAGVCPSAFAPFPSEYGLCIAGVDLDAKNQHLVYYSAPNDNAIGELNTKISGYYDNVRFWSLADLSYKLKEDIRDPRQLKVEHEDGKTVVWVVTGSGHLVRLIPQSGNYALMSAHRMPDADNDPFGVAPDGRAIGYTAVSDPMPFGTNRKDKVGMLLPVDNLVQVAARTKRAPTSFPPVLVERQDTRTVTDFLKADPKVVKGRVDRTGGGTFVDAFINMPQPPDAMAVSMLPTGITPDYGSKVGTFFYSVGLNNNQFLVNRIGRAFLPPAERGKHARDDDDFDGDGKKNKHEDDDDDGDGTHNTVDHDDDNDCKNDDFDDHDDDNDGHDDKWDDPRKKETRHSKDHTTAGGSSTTHPMVVPAGATLVVAQAVASNATTPVRVEIISPTGIVLASPLATPGVGVATLVAPAAGTYTVRVTNLGLTAASFTTDLITQELWPAVSTILP